jgi:hypothetical protein
MVGVTAGAFCFWNFIGNERALQVIVGVLSVCFVLFQWMQAVIFEVVQRRRTPKMEGFLWERPPDLLQPLHMLAGRR